jgi:hypothetical protein
MEHEGLAFAPVSVKALIQDVVTVERNRVKRGQK